ncbi:hypothetical protein [Aeromonas veronii]|uniref:hypothetical protein n=1 Tax=Aeromonas veronii TaxID=654 RepID=UPI002443945A|nr:hypothetical protein [Aeromonas veronii]
MKIASPQVIISMPAENYQDAFSTIFGEIEFKKRNNKPLTSVEDFNIGYAKGEVFSYI